jgi:hypothetical protein
VGGRAGAISGCVGIAWASTASKAILLVRSSMCDLAWILSRGIGLETWRLPELCAWAFGPSVMADGTAPCVTGSRPIEHIRSISHCTALRRGSVG